MVPLVADAVAEKTMDAGAKNTCPSVGLVILIVGGVPVVTLILTEALDENPLLSVALATTL